MENENEISREVHGIVHWESAILLLSLEIVAPFWDEIGLNFNDPAGVRKILRSHIVERKKAEGAIPPNGDIVGPSRVLRAALLAKIEMTEGPGGRDRLVKWIEFDFSRAQKQHKWVHGWQHLLGQICNYGELSLMSSGVSDLAAHDLLELSEHWLNDRKQIATKVDEARSMMLDKWDQSQQITQNEFMEFEVDLLYNLETLLEEKYFEIRWEQTLELISPSEIDSLSRWGQGVLTVQEHMPISYGILPPLDQMLEFLKVKTGGNKE